MLILSLSLSQATVVLMIAASTLAGRTLTGVVEQAFWPIALQFTGLFVFSSPIVMLMQKIGRKGGLSFCAFVGMISAALSAYALIIHSFPLFCAAAFLYGIPAVGVQQYRFAAIEMAKPGQQAIAISYVLSGGIVAAILGPKLGVFSRELVEGAQFAGTYGAVFLLCLLSLMALQLLRAPQAPKAEQALQQQKTQGAQRSNWELFTQPKLIAAVLAAMMGYGVMNFIMIATPTAMEICGFTFSDSSNIISMHVLGMFVPSFFTGHLIKRFGESWIIALGVLCNLATVAINLMGLDYSHFAFSLILLGIGWNFCFIGGTSLLAQCYAPHERAKVQAFNETAISLLVAVTAIFSGQALGLYGWEIVNLAAIPAMWLVAAALFFVWIRGRRQAITS